VLRRAACPGRPVVGRTFDAAEEQKGGIAIVTERSWRGRLSGARPAVGQTLTLDGVPHTIVGIVPTPPAADVGTADVFVTRPYEIGMPKARASMARERVGESEGRSPSD